ncbi:hypothetical protein [Methanomethylovorans sp.]
MEIENLAHEKYDIAAQVLAFAEMKGEILAWKLFKIQKYGWN